MLSGIAWDHINVFPTYENYVEQFKIFVDSIVRGGSINYNEEDAEVKRVVEASENQIRKIEGLDKLVNLKELDLSENNITKIEGLDHLQHLEVLDLSGNPMGDNETLPTLKN